MKKIFILLIFFLQGINSIAQTCNPIDPSFGTGGIAVGYTYNGNGNAPYSRNIIVLPDNKIIQIANIAALDSLKPQYLLPTLPNFPPRLRSCLRQIINLIRRAFLTTSILPKIIQVANRAPSKKV